MISKIRKFFIYRQNLYFFLLGFLLVLTTAPFYLFPVFFLLFPLLLKALFEISEVRILLKRSFFFGYGFALSHFYWISFSFLVRGGLLNLLFPVVFLFIPAYFALYYVAQFYVLHHLKRKYSLGRWGFCLVFAILWVLFEFSRSKFLFLVSFAGFPWGYLGYDIFFSNYLAQFAEYISVYGLSFAILLLSCLPFALQKIGRKYLILLLSLLLLAFALLSFVGKNILMSHKGNNELSLDYKIVHPNFKKHHGFSQSNIAENLYEIKGLSEGGEKRDLVIWPEGAISYFVDLSDERQDLFSFLSEGSFFRKGLIIGAPRISYEGNESSFFNSLFLLSDKGELLSYYDKRILVPFGEFMPYRFLFNFLPIVSNSGDFSFGKGQQEFQLGKVKISALICYDALFPNVVARGDSDLIVNISNDIWFIHEVFGVNISLAPFQHLDMLRMRAIEARQPILRATNRGISAEIDKAGEIVKFLSYREQGVIEGAL